MPGVSRAPEPLIDAHGRALTDLRVSVTDRCNFRCRYCMPAEGMEWLDRSHLLSFEEIVRVVRVLTSLGIRDVRLTGGEPLARREFPKLVAMLRAIDDIDDLAVTTNGYLLERDADALVAAGINRVNVSVDALARDRFHEITRRDALPQVLRGLEAIAARPRSTWGSASRRVISWKRSRASASTETLMRSMPAATRAAASRSSR